MDRIRNTVAIFALVWLVGSPVFAQDDLKPLIKKGEGAINSGDYQAALDYFQQVVQKLQNMVGAAFEQFMPKALPGWEAGELERNTWAGTTEDFSGNMVNLKQEFKRTSDGRVCKVNLMNWPTTVASMRRSFDMYKSMGEMMNADPNVKMSFEERGPWTILRIVEKEEQRTQLQAVSENVMVMIEVNAAGATEADQYFKGMNLAGIQKQAERK